MDSFLKNYKNFIYKSVPKKHAHIMADYVYFVELGLKLTNNQQITPAVKSKKFDLLYKQLFKNCTLKNNVISRLQTSFINENISLSLLSDMINIFKLKATNNLLENKTLFNNYQQTFASNFSRFVMVLNDLSPSVYIPLTSAVMCCLIISTNEDIKNNVERLDGLLKDAKILPLIVQNKLFRFKAIYFIKTLEVLIAKYRQGLPLKISNFNLIKNFIYASFKWFFVRVKTLKNKGI